MQGKVVVFTGATNGLGAVAAEKLAGMGARLLFIARSKERGEATLAKLRQAGPNLDHRAFYADLSLIAETKRVAGEIAAVAPQVDVLVNNAGAMFTSRHMTAEGLEKTFALNHMSYFVLTALLRGKLGPNARIVNTASDAHRVGRLDVANVATAFSAARSYGASKLCNILFTRALAERLAGTGVTANCLHPGFVDSNFGAEAGGWLFAKVMKLAQKVAAISVEEGAKTLIYLASSPEVAGVSGNYFDKCKIAQPASAAKSDEDAAKLWALSEKLADLRA
jgi:NAD(P)-dependent dehydrogenase (short-subunit alcohol dehydrogenase family)